MQGTLTLDNIPVYGKVEEKMIFVKLHLCARNSAKDFMHITQSFKQSSVIGGVPISETGIRKFRWKIKGLVLGRLSLEVA